MGNHNFGSGLLGVFGLPLLQFISRGMDRCSRVEARIQGIQRGYFLTVSCR